MQDGLLGYVKAGKKNEIKKTNCLADLKSLGYIKTRQVCKAPLSLLQQNIL